MTTKDWKQEQKDVWINKKLMYVIAIIFKENLINKYQVVKSKNIFSCNFQIIGRDFKTKSEALKFAKAYMRKN